MLCCTFLVISLHFQALASLFYLGPNVFFYFVFLSWRSIRSNVLVGVLGPIQSAPVVYKNLRLMHRSSLHSSYHHTYYPLLTRSSTHCFWQKWLPPHFLRSKGKCPSLTQSQSQSSHSPSPVTKRGQGRGRREERGESLALRPPTSLETTPAARKARIRTGGNTLTLVNNNVEDGPLGVLLNADVPFRAASVVC